jgi:membrane-associated phospholipid phosphatase
VDLPAAESRQLTWPRLSRVTWVFVGLLLAYGAFTAAILLKTPVLDMDSSIVNLDLKHRYPQLFHPVHTYVMLGQRRPVMQLAMPLLLFISLRHRTPRPMVSLFVAIVVLNLSVGVVKVATGRLGPRYGDPVDAMFRGGDIYPSGHVSNAVVMYGLVAMFVAPRLRPYAVALASFLCVTIGLGTLFINTHWLTDVIGGWFAGGLVLCSLTWLVPPAERVVRSCFSPIRAALSVAGACAGLYFGMGWLTDGLGPWVAKDFGGWLVAALAFSALPWCTPPFERALAAGWRRLRAGRRPPRLVAAAPPARAERLHDELTPIPLESVDSTFVA